eukprot:Amastigsp_a10800_7.p4 type:complete len:127 gc:universal Amastigsp_a10800_7:111-491(+)
MFCQLNHGLDKHTRSKRPSRAHKPAQVKPRARRSRSRSCSLAASVGYNKQALRCARRPTHWAPRLRPNPRGNTRPAEHMAARRHRRRHPRLEAEMAVGNWKRDAGASPCTVGFAMRQKDRALDVLS